MNNMQGKPGPKQSRLSKTAIFEDFEMFCFDGDYNGVSKDQLKVQQLIILLAQMQFIHFPVLYLLSGSANERIFALYFIK